MFKKTEESEWTRFSRALGWREQAREPDEPALPGKEGPDAGPTRVRPPAPAEPEPAPVPLAPARPALPEPELAAEHQPRAPVSTMVEPARPLADSSRPMADSSRPVAWTSAADD